MNSVVHFEFPADDPEALTTFFNKVFGWNFQRFGEEKYWLTTANSDGTVGIGGAVMGRKHPMQPIVNSIEVESIDTMVGVVRENGGELVVEKTTLPGVGYLAYFKDPAGNIHGLWQNDTNAA